LAIFLTFASGVLVQTTTTSWPAPRLLAAGIAPIIIGLSVLVASAWTSPPSLALFLIGAAVAGAGSGAIIRGSLTIVITTARPDNRAGVPRLPSRTACGAPLGVGDHGGEEDVTDPSFQGAKGHLAGLAFVHLSLEVSPSRAVAMTDLGHRDHVDGVVELSVAAPCDGGHAKLPVDGH
jgi:hypothetical protein